MNTKKLGAGAFVIVAAGTVMFVASFFAFYELNRPRYTFGTLVVGGSMSWNAWSKSAFSPVSNLPALFGLVMALQIALTTFSSVPVPPRVLGFDWKQLHLVLAIQSAVLMLAFLFRDKGAFDFGFGFWLMLVSSIALVVGAVMFAREPAAAR